MLCLSMNQVQECLKILRQNQVVALPTETVYGLACRWSSLEAREEIYRLKHRPASKQLQMLAPSLEAAGQAGVLVDDRLRKLAAAFWPGPLTVVAPALDGTTTIGIRIPAHPFVLELLQAFGEPLACTSANLSGKPAALTAHDAVFELDGEPAALVDGGVVTVTAGLSSTVITLVGEDTPRLLRQGPISLEEIQKVLAGKQK